MLLVASLHFLTCLFFLTTAVSAATAHVANQASDANAGLIPATATISADGTENQAHVPFNAPKARLSSRASGDLSCWNAPSDFSVFDANILYLSLVGSAETYDLGYFECQERTVGTANAMMCGLNRSGRVGVSSVEWAAWVAEIMEGCVNDGSGRVGGIYPWGRDVSVVLDRPGQ
jgi:hypothetical protein